MVRLQAGCSLCRALHKTETVKLTRWLFAGRHPERAGSQHTWSRPVQLCCSAVKLRCTALTKAGQQQRSVHKGTPTQQPAQSCA